MKTCCSHWSDWVFFHFLEMEIEAYISLTLWIFMLVWKKYPFPKQKKLEKIDKCYHLPHLSCEVSWGQLRPVKSWLYMLGYQLQVSPSDFELNWLRDTTWIIYEFFSLVKTNGECDFFHILIMWIFLWWKFLA